MALTGQLKRTVGPVAMSATLTTNIYNNSSALIYDNIKQIHITNITAGAVTFSIFLGATGANAAGTELWKTVSIAGGASFDWYGNLKLVSTDFLVGGASAGASLTITIMGEQVVV
jgi:hypothetical protein